MKLIIDGVVYQNQARGGVSRIYSEILPRMCDLDSQLSVELLTSGVLKQPVPTHINIKHTTFPHGEGAFPLRWLYRLRRKIRSIIQSTKLLGNQQNIWHSTYYTRPFRWQGPIVVTLLDMIHEYYPDLFSRPVDQAFRRHKRSCLLEADAIICISQSTRDDLLQYYDISPERTHVIPLACSDVFQQLPPTSKNAGQRPFLLYVGGRHHYKNFRRLLQAYSTWQVRKDVDLVVVGNAWTSEETQLLVQFNLSQHVELISGVTDMDLCKLYNEAAVFVYPSLYEGFGIPLLEAMSCGCPIVASNIPSTIEVAADNVFYFDPYSINDLQSALLVALESNRKSEKVSTGLKHVREFSWDRCAKQTLEVYRQLPSVNK